MNYKKSKCSTKKNTADMREKYEDDFQAGMGAEAIKTLLEEIDLEQLAAELKEELFTAAGQKRVRILKRLEVVEAFRAFRQPSRMDDFRCDSGNSAGYSPNGTVGRRHDLQLLT